MQSTKDKLSAAARIAFENVRWCELNCPDDAERLNLAHSEFQLHAKALSDFLDQEFKMRTIEELKARLQGYEQDRALGVISIPEFNAHKARINAQIEQLDPRQDFRNSPDPTELGALKRRVYKTFSAYFKQLGSKTLMAIQLQLAQATDQAAVEKVYSDWRTRCRLKNIADLPELIVKPQNAAA